MCVCVEFREGREWWEGKSGGRNKSSPGASLIWAQRGRHKKTPLRPTLSLPSSFLPYEIGKQHWLFLPKEVITQPPKTRHYLCAEDIS